MKDILKPVPLLIIGVLLLLCIIVLTGPTKKEKAEQEHLTEEHLKLDKAIRRNDSLQALSAKRYEELVRCSALNAELRKKEVATIQKESEQDENIIISQPDVADDELLRKIARQYEAAHRDK